MRKALFCGMILAGGLLTGILIQEMHIIKISKECPMPVRFKVIKEKK